jgi:hypothetical protein
MDFHLAKRSRPSAAEDSTAAAPAAVTAAAIAGTDVDPAMAALRAWARALGLYGDAHLHVRPSPLGGLGVFVDARQLPEALFTRESGGGLVMAALPTAAVLSAAKARASEIGQACAAVFPERVPGAFLLQLDMALGKARFIKTLIPPPMVRVYEGFTV